MKSTKLFDSFRVIGLCIAGMAYNAPTRRVPAFTFLPILASMIVGMLIVVIIASGSRPGVGDKLSFLRVGDTLSFFLGISMALIDSIG